jgi:hypothetical protein
MAQCHQMTQGGLPKCHMALHVVVKKNHTDRQIILQPLAL